MVQAGRGKANCRMNSNSSESRPVKKEEKTD
jgi:hypothetical protein